MDNSDILVTASLAHTENNEKGFLIWKCDKSMPDKSTSDKFAFGRKINMLANTILASETWSEYINTIPLYAYNIWPLFIVQL